MSNGYQVAIPSYLRPVMLAQRTLPFLIEGGIRLDRITVFVHDNDPHLFQYQEITEAAGVNLEVTTARGINEQRAAIRSHYGDGTMLVQVDDDVTGLYEALDAKTLDPVHDVAAFFEAMFREMLVHGLYSWGLTPVMNAYFMKPGAYSTGLKFVIFSLFGTIVRRDHPVNTVTVATKDDYEYSLRSWWYDGGILRNEHVAAKADIYKAPGGCQNTRTVELAEESVQSLIRQWPGLVRRNERRKSDFPEILLARRPRHAGYPITSKPPGA